MRKEVITHQDPKSPISEIFKTLRTNIQFMSTKGKLKTILVTSTLPGEGKSWVSSNLAVTFAQAGKKVILIDADMRKGRQYTIFGVSPRPGLSNYLSEIDIERPEETDISMYLQKTEVENLLLMPAGNVPPNPSELLVSPQMTKLLEDLKQVCDLIVIDGTPCELVTDSVILSRVADATVIVTAHKETKKDNLARVIKNIQNVGGKLVGVVINKMPVSAKKYNEKYYYHSTSTHNTNNFNTKNIANELKKETQNITKINTQKSKIDIEKESDLGRPLIFNNEDRKSTLDKTNDILNQINSYLDKEKDDLNK